MAAIAGDFIIHVQWLFHLLIKFTLYGNRITIDSFRKIDQHGIISAISGTGIHGKWVITN